MKAESILVSNTYKSFISQTKYKFSKIIVSVDGNYDLSVLNEIAPDVILHQRNRKGYVYCILETIKLIDTEFFFWLEEDWSLSRQLNIENNLRIMAQHPDWAEVIYSKFADELSADYVPVGEGDLFISKYGFSANPCICRTAHILNAFKSFSEQSKPAIEEGFEEYLTRFYKENGIKCIIEHSFEHAIVAHSGYLESTPRFYHMTLSTNPDKIYYRPATYYKTKPGIIRRLIMFCKLALVFIRISFLQFFKLSAYEHSFRIVTSSKNYDNL